MSKDKKEAQKAEKKAVVSYQQQQDLLKNTLRLPVKISNNKFPLDINDDGDKIAISKERFVTEHGAVNRGICNIDKNGNLITFYGFSADK